MSHFSRRTWLAASASGLVAAWAPGHVAIAATWPDERSMGIFRCHADFELEPFAGLLEEVGQLEDDLASDLGLPQPSEDIHLFLFGRKDTYQDYLNQHFPRIPVRKALFIKGRGPGMVFAHRSGELAIDVRHECTHALLHTYVDNLPLWLDEGLAEYYETPAAERVKHSPYVGATRWNARLGYVPDLGKLERLTDISQMQRDEYRDAWAWTHVLLHASDETRTILREHLQLLADARPTGKLSEQLKRQIAEPAELYRNHFRRWDAARFASGS
jgi:hypothetical protein